jgi:RNA polymerase sigma factor (sigma-70 family)
LIEQVFREQWSRVLASLVGFLGDFDLAEEACQEAFVIAAERWPRDGEPANPLGWLVATARNRALDRLRRQRTLAEKTRLLEGRIAAEAVEDVMDDPVIPDERLELIFCCCHPALAIEAQVALTLRALGGLSTEEIASAFLLAPETMKRRLSRAKAKIAATGIPFAIPDDHLLPNRLSAVLAVVYLIFNEGYGGRVDLAAEAIRLGRSLAELMPDESDVLGLLALMLLTWRSSTSSGSVTTATCTPRAPSYWPASTDPRRPGRSTGGHWSSRARSTTGSSCCVASTSCSRELLLGRARHARPRFGSTRGGSRAARVRRRRGRRAGSRSCPQRR